MSVISADLEVVDDVEATKTYKLSDEAIQGFIDNLEALKQSINKELNTEKYEYAIYSFDYGIELESLIGKDTEYVKIELKRRIEECLLRDEHIISVDNFIYTGSGDEMLCKFDVNSIYGNVTIMKEVNV